MSEFKKSFWQGVRAELPLLIGVFPFGMIYGALAMNVGLSTLSAQLMSSTVFAGSAQFISIGLLRDHAPELIIILTIAVVNLRHLLYSASIAPYIKDLSLKRKILIAYLLTDEAYAPSVVYCEKTTNHKSIYGFILGAGVALWTTWQLSTACGVFLGAGIPPSWQLDFALPLTFIVMVVPLLINLPMLGAALSAGLVAILTFTIPYKLGLIFAAITGIIVGTLLERR